MLIALMLICSTVVVYLLPMVIGFFIGRKPASKWLNEHPDPPHALVIATLLEHLKQFDMSTVPAEIISGTFAPVVIPPPFVTGRLSKLVSNVAMWIYLPAIVLRVAILSKYGLTTLNRLPLDLYELSLWSYLTIAFVSIYTHHYIIGIAIIFVLYAITANACLSLFRQSGGSIGLAMLPRHKLGFRDVLNSGLTLLLCFTGATFALSCIDPSAYSEPLDLFNSFYVTLSAATVGFIDIVPKTTTAKILACVSIANAWLYTVVVITSVISTMLTKHLDAANLPQPDSNRPRASL